jgi:hypothetical protein
MNTKKFTITQIKENSTGQFFQNCHKMQRNGDTIKLCRQTYTGKNCTYFFTREVIHFTTEIKSSFKLWEFRHETGEIYLAPNVAYEEPTNDFFEFFTAEIWAKILARENETDGKTAQDRRGEMQIAATVATQGELL